MTEAPSHYRSVRVLILSLFHTREHFHTHIPHIYTTAHRQCVTRLFICLELWLMKGQPLSYDRISWPQQPKRGRQSIIHECGSVHMCVRSVSTWWASVCFCLQTRVYRVFGWSGSNAASVFACMGPSFFFFFFSEFVFVRLISAEGACQTGNRGKTDNLNWNKKAFILPSIASVFHLIITIKNKWFNTLLKCAYITNCMGLFISACEKQLRLIIL